MQASVVGGLAAAWFLWSSHLGLYIISAFIQELIDASASCMGDEGLRLTARQQANGSTMPGNHVNRPDSKTSKPAAYGPQIRLSL